MSSNYYFTQFSIKREKDIDNILTNYKIKYVNICSYKITDETIVPFISYLFIFDNNFHNKTLQLPRINIENLDYDGETILDFIKRGILNQLGKLDMTYKDSIRVEGIDFFNEDAYIFLDITKLNIIFNIDNDYRFITINEIINKMSYKYDINENNVEFFTNNISYGLLYDNNGKQYETPVIGYVGSSKKSLDYSFHMGIIRQRDIFGESYYFTSYENAAKGSEYVIRIAVFLGNLHLKENFPEDNYDDLTININNNFLSRLTDYCGLWKKKYDSIYVGRLELDNGEQFLKGPLYAFKRVEQHIPLSYESVHK